MTNFEFYESEILGIISGGKDLGVINDKPGACSYHSCDECKFKRTQCSKEVIKWLYEEHEETPKLTKKERLFCELVESGWIARDRRGHLYFFEDYIREPYKGENVWRHDAITYFLADEETNLFHVPFTFIKWEDEKPWSIEDLLKLEVEE